MANTALYQAPSLRPSTHVAAPPRKPRRTLLAAFGILGGMAAVVGLGIAGLFATVTCVMKNSDAYRTSLELVQHSPIAERELGSPIEAGSTLTGSIQRRGGFGNAELSIAVAGPRGKGTAHVVSHRDGARWVVEGAQLETGSSLFQLAP